MAEVTTVPGGDARIMMQMFSPRPNLPPLPSKLRTFGALVRAKDGGG